MIFAGISALIVLGTEDSTPHPDGLEFIGAIVWRGLVYGAVDGLLLSASGGSRRRLPAWQ